MTDIVPALPGGLSPALWKVLQEVPESVASDAYARLVPRLTADEFRDAAREAFCDFTPDQRRQIARHIRTQRRRHDIRPPRLDASGTGDVDPRRLADAVADIHAKGGPGLVEQILAPGGTHANLLVKFALIGITAIAAERVTARR